ncbi:MAG TPA: MFS transporter [Mycobacteriales bacterium]|nr:MFS transporter [Mycobacteriales bacterium]
MSAEPAALDPAEPAGSDDPVGVPRQGLGRDFTLLWSASTLSSAGDGVSSTAMPLLAAALTSSPALVGLATSIGSLPWLLVGVFSGALVDRWDRLRVMWVVDTLRFGLVAGFAAAVATGAGGIGLLLAVGLLLGVGDTLFGTASQAVVPMLVSREHGRLERANGRLSASYTVSGQFVGPPVGGFLFGVARGLPFATDAASYGLSAVGVWLIARRRAPAGPENPTGPTAAGRGSLLAEVREGFGWLFGHRLLRTMAIAVSVTNLSFTASEAILVLFARQRLGLGPVGYGVLLTAVAAGALLGSVVVSRISRLLGPGTSMAAGLALVAASRIGLGLSAGPVLAAAMLVVSGAAIAVFNVVGVSLRQRVTPDRLLGRVVSAYRLVGLGGIALGGLAGGLLAGRTSIRVPFLAGGAVVVVVTVVAALLITNRAVAEAEALAT